MARSRAVTQLVEDKFTRSDGPLYKLWPTQQKGMDIVGLGPDWMMRDDAANELLYGGQAGGGKSHLMRAAAVTMCLIWPGAVISIFRRTYPELEETHIRAIQQELPPSLGRYVHDRHEFKFNNGSILAFRYCDREHDVYRYQSAEWQGLLFDEATHFTGSQIEYLKSRVRAPADRFPNWRRIIIFGSNPGNVGHAYFKSTYVDMEPAGTGAVRKVQIYDKYSGKQLVVKRAFLKARLEDNPALDPEDYRTVLAGITDETTREGLLAGNWDIFAGQYFKEWRFDKHVIPPVVIPASWTRWVAIDYGFAAPFCALWFARSPNSKLILVYRELYGAGLYDFEQAQLIRKNSKGEKIYLFIADTQMFNQRREANKPSIAKVYAKYKVPLVAASKQRIQGWNMVRHNLHWNDELGISPRMRIFNTCTNLIRTLPLMQHDTINPEDVADKVDKMKTEDHAPDALRYGLFAEGPTFRKKLLKEYRIDF